MKKTTGMIAALSLVMTPSPIFNTNECEYKVCGERVPRNKRFCSQDCRDKHYGREARNA